MDFGIRRGFWANSPCAPRHNCSSVHNAHSQVLGFRVYTCVLFTKCILAMVLCSLVTQNCCKDADLDPLPWSLWEYLPFWDSPPQPPARQPFVITFRWQSPNILFLNLQFFFGLFFFLPFSEHAPSPSSQNSDCAVVTSSSTRARRAAGATLTSPKP